MWRTPLRRMWPLRIKLLFKLPYLFCIFRDIDHIAGAIQQNNDLMEFRATSNVGGSVSIDQNDVWNKLLHRRRFVLWECIGYGNPTIRRTCIYERFHHKFLGSQCFFYYCDGRQSTGNFNRRTRYFHCGRHYFYTTVFSGWKQYTNYRPDTEHHTFYQRV